MVLSLLAREALGTIVLIEGGILAPSLATFKMRSSLQDAGVGSVTRRNPFWHIWWQAAFFCSRTLIIKD